MIYKVKVSNSEYPELLAPGIKLVFADIHFFVVDQQHHDIDDLVFRKVFCNKE